MASVISSLPGQQQQQPAGEIEQPVPQVVSSSTSSPPSNSSGSIGPFFAVISVLAVLAILSCILGRMCTRREANPLETTKHRGSLWGWIKRKCRRRCVAGDVEVGEHVMTFRTESNESKAKDGEVPQP